TPRATGSPSSPQREDTGRPAPSGTQDDRPVEEAVAADAPRWSWSLRSNNQANATIRSLSEPAGTLFFGHRANECVWVPEPAEPGGTDTEQLLVPDSIRITAREAGLLQTFPADYPWAGNKGQRFSQIGNAVPPRLAAHLLAPHLQLPLDPDDFTLAA
ncbi:DNA cytosine methyltransferase, partial [Streptomyces niveus]|uniref:DNA cytosine methyltransferase n=1 Tax=Streptomyces niveus TaxID=193462 RepID=UPI00341B5159